MTIERAGEHDQRPALGDPRCEPTTRALEQAWRDPPGIIGFFTTVDHKRLGMRYIYTAFVFFFLAGIQALVMRMQLSQPEAGNLVGGSLQRAVHDARDDDDLPVQHARAGRVRELPAPAPARDPRPRLPAAQRVQLLGLPASRASFMYLSYFTGTAPERRLVRLRAADVEGVLARASTSTSGGWA